MHNTVERFNAFSTNRLIKKEENISIGNCQKLILSPTKNAFFLFVHLLNRSITNLPWVFWISIIFSFIQLAIAVLIPFNEPHWEHFPELITMCKVLSIVLRFVPISSSEIIQIIMFIIYSIFVIFHFVLFITTIFQIKRKRDANILLKIFFFYSYLILPIIKSSLICVVSEEMTQIVRNPSLGTFFLSLIALIILVLQFFMSGVVQFAMGSSPSPNMSNPLAIWGPCAWRSVIYELFCLALFTFLELIRSINSKITLAIVLSIFIILSTIHAIFQSSRTYYISYLAYEYIGTILWSITIYSIFHIVIAFCPGVFPYWSIILIWVLLPGITFTVMRTMIQLELRHILKVLNLCSTPATQMNEPCNKIDDQERNIDGDPSFSSMYDPLEIKGVVQAIFVARAACLTNHSSFLDLSLIHYLMDHFHEGYFYFLHLTFLIQNQGHVVLQLIDEFLEEFKPTLLQSCVIFQIVTSIQESSNDIPPQLLREISKQKLQAMKCQQLISKFWTSTYKGDVNAMARQAFSINKNINELNKSWKLLVLRYPFSVPVLKDYIGYLSTTGTQHRIVEAILTNHPNLNEVTSNQIDQDLNVSMMHQAIESSVDRRPIYSLKKVHGALIISILIALIFFIAILVVSFIFSSKYSEEKLFIIQSEKFTILMSNILNIFDDMKGNPSNEYDYRANLYLVSAELSNALNLVLAYMPNNILVYEENKDYNLYLECDLYNSTSKTDIVNVLRMIAYICRSLSFVPFQNNFPQILARNIVDTIGMMNSTLDKVVFSSGDLINTLSKYSPLFYIFNWGLLIIVMVPLLYFSIKSLKDEMTYLFSIYLTIPRSVLLKFINNTGGDAGKNEKKTLQMLMSTSFAHHTATTIHDEEDENKQNMNIADSFKVLVSDSSANLSVLPKNFIAKAIVVFGLLCGVLALLSTICCFLFVSNTKKFNKYFRTQELVAERTILSSIAMHGITSHGIDINISYLEVILNRASELNTAILFKDKKYEISEDALNNQKISDISIKDSCEDKSNFSCRSQIFLLEYFLNSAKNITSAIANSANNSIINTDTVSLRTLFINDLYPKMLSIQEELNNYVSSSILMFNTILLILIIVGIVVVMLIFILLALPVIREVQATIDSVKLPLKHIPPIEIADLQKVLMYLQGESDYKRGGQNEKGNDSQGGNSVLNIMLSPFAIFEDDLSLLFANNAFYSILGTSRESVIGLQLADIFSTVIPYKKDDSHPFNSLLDTISQLQRGVSPVNVIEIKTNLEVPKQRVKPTMIRMVGICNSSNKHKNTNEQNQSEEMACQKNLKASAYGLFINDISQKKELDEKMKYETEVTQKLMESSLSKSLSNLLKKNDVFESKKYSSIPFLIFSIQPNTQDEEIGEEMIISCALLLRLLPTALQNNPTIIKLQQDFPNWIFISGTENESLSITELLSFAFQINESYIANSTTNYTLGAIVHIGELSVIPLNFNLPIVEVIGRGYTKIMSMIHSYFLPKTIQCSQEIVDIIADNRSFTIIKSDNYESSELSIIKKETDFLKSEEIIC
ncbi:hypothetical protein TRFO_05410 [Tritrichomonas foetus]|uniref:PAS domain-containing protein n=1 Tax=Tritrichomonas foetus TaxID=1144522 RepID=A0A1J4K5R3_9EUKA|nr:hypothetical protein TRFO_05410 [Tritrichomonas foetus]|eukprot:OHT06743.1 hypothetical protein TRFO_05410 [Tritrichomonas foetus]